MTSFLKHLEKILKEAQFDPALFEKSEEFPLGCLLLYLGEDQENREKALIITAAEQEVGAALHPPKTTKKPTFKLQMEFAFPFTFKDETFDELASLVLFLNRTLDLPGLELDETTNHLYFRHVHLTHEAVMDKDLFLALVGYCMVIHTWLSEPLERVASGRAACHEILEEALQKGPKT